MKILKILSLFWLVALLSACGLSTPKPTVTLVDVGVGQVNVLETGLNFLVRISNERDEPLSLTGGVYDFHINGISIGRGTSNKSVVIPRLDSVLERVTVHVSNLTVFSRIQSLIDAKDFSYRLESRLIEKHHYGDSSLRVTTEDRLTIENLNRPTISNSGKHVL